MSKKKPQRPVSITPPITPLWEDGGDLVGALQAIFTVAGEVLTMKRLVELTGFSEGILEQGIQDLQKVVLGRESCQWSANQNGSEIVPEYW